jgi:phosphopantetheinyl transferase (holo-ACP synthase)
MNDDATPSAMPAVSHREICGITVWSTAIDTDGTRGTRRARECSAVATLIRAAFGDNATLGHHPSGAPFIIPTTATNTAASGGIPTSTTDGTSATNGTPNTTTDGTPEIISAISITHCNDTAMLAVAPEGTAIGIDCEQPRRALRNVAPRILSEKELAAWSASDALLLQAWTIKEAVYKAAGIQGLDFAKGINLPAPSAFSGKIEINPEYVATVADGRRFHLITISGLPTTTIAVAADV